MQKRIESKEQGVYGQRVSDEAYNTVEAKEHRRAVLAAAHITEDMETLGEAAPSAPVYGAPQNRQHQKQHRTVLRSSIGQTELAATQNIG